MICKNYKDCIALSLEDGSIAWQFNYSEPSAFQVLSEDESIFVVMDRGMGSGSDRRSDLFFLDTADGHVLQQIQIPCDGFHVRTEMHPYDDQYVKFMEETGAEYVGRMMMWIYFRKKTEDGVFDLYSDIDSKISHLDRIGKVLLAIGGANLIIGVINSWNPSIRLGWINLLCATLLMYALGRIHGKKEALEKERELHE